MEGCIYLTVAQIEALWELSRNRDQKGIQVSSSADAESPLICVSSFKLYPEDRYADNNHVIVNANGSNEGWSR